MQIKRLVSISTALLAMAAALVVLTSACAPAPAAAPTAAPKPAAAPAATQPAAAKPAGPAKTWKVHILWTQDNPVTVGAVDPFAKELFEKTGGAIKPEVYYTGSLGFKGPEGLRVAQQGSVDVAYIDFGHVSGDWPDLGVFNLPGLFSSPTEQHDKGYLVTKDKLDKALDTQWQVKLIGGYAADEQIALGRKPLATLADFKGQKMRSFNPQLSDMLEAVGATAVSIPFNEMYSALERGVVDAAVTGMAAHVSLKNYEVAKNGYYGIGLGGYAPGIVVVSGNAWKALTPDQQKIVADLGAKYTAIFMKEVAEKMSGDSKAIMEKAGVKFTKASAADVQTVKGLATQQVWNKWEQQSGPFGKELLADLQKGR